MPRFHPSFAHMRAALAVLAALAGLSLFLASGPALAGEALFASTLTQLYTAPEGDKALATIRPGVPLEVVERSGARIHVEITGWAPDGAEDLLFKAIGQRILLARLSDATDATGLERKVIARKTDYYEDVWLQLRLGGWIDAKATTTDIAALWQDASKLFHKRCTRCHALHQPDEFKANQWPSILKIMTVRAGLSPADKALITQFLQTYAKDQTGAPVLAAADTGEAPEITGDKALAARGAALFADNGCNACHGDDAKTPAAAGYPRLAGQDAGYLYKQLRDFASGARGNDADAIMRDVAGALNDADSRAIAYWLSTVQP